MGKPKRTATELLQIATTAVLGASALLTALTTFNESLARIRDEIFSPRVPANVWLLASAVLLIVALAVATRVFASRSRLVNRNVDVNAAENPEQLKGRQDDILNLTNVCLAHAQVNLIGESGAGKSALIRGGLIPYLARTSLVSVYMNRWGRDWIEGPRTALLQEIRRIPSLAAAEDIDNAIITAAAAGGKLLFVFDQFDDYQTAHAGRFRNSSGTLLCSDELCDANPFWRKIRDILRSGDAHALFVTRADTAAVLDCVRFAEPRVYPLDRLQPIAAYELLDQLFSGEDAIESPENGWPSLRERLVRDLSEEGSILPIQMKLALKGLTALPYLTIREYERRGGLHGLEAADVEWRITNTVRLHSVSSTQALALLADMVDREARKTRSRAIDQLSHAVPELTAARIEPILQEWETKELVRQRVNPDNNEPVWVLDHDYLSNGVLAAEARANRSSLLLEESEQDYRASGSNLWRRWRTLLSPSEQLALLRDRMRGAFRYGNRRGFAFVSLLRLVPVLLVLVLGGLELQRQSLERHRSAARAILENLGFSDEEDGLDKKEVEALWALAGAAPRTRSEFLPISLGSVGSATRLLKRSGATVHAVIGVDRAMKDEIVARVLRPAALDTQVDRQIRRASYATLKELGHLDVEVADAMLESGDSEFLALTEEQWDALVNRERPERLPAARDLLMARLRAPDNWVFEVALRGIQTLMKRNVGINEVVHFFEEEKAPHRVVKLAQALSKCALPPAVRKQVRDRLLAMLLNESSKATLPSLTIPQLRFSGDYLATPLINVTAAYGSLARISHHVEMIGGVAVENSICGAGG
jgi:hypothetical protein